MPEPNRHWDRGVVVSTTLGICFFTTSASPSRRRARSPGADWLGALLTQAAHRPYTVVCGGLTETVLRWAGLQGPGSSSSQGSAAQLLSSGREEEDEEEEGDAQAGYHVRARRG